MDPAGTDALLEAIKHLHGCAARHVETVHVVERAPTGETAWEGDVEVFELDGHPKARRAYAWSEATTGTKRRFFAVLGLGPVTGAAEAVRASILADASSKTHHGGGG
jgi:hypothetical protein